MIFISIQIQPLITILPQLTLDRQCGGQPRSPSQHQHQDRLQQVCVCVRVHVSLHKEHKEDAASSYPVPLLKNEPKGTKSNFVFWFLSSSSFYPNDVVVVCELCASEFSKGHVVFLYRLCCSAWQSRAWFTHDDAGGDPVCLPLRSVYINYSSKLQSVWP